MLDGAIPPSLPIRIGVRSDAPSSSVASFPGAGAHRVARFGLPPFRLSTGIREVNATEAFQKMVCMIEVCAAFAREGDRILSERRGARTERRARRSAAFGGSSRRR